MCENTNSTNWSFQLITPGTESVNNDVIVPGKGYVTYNYTKYSSLWNVFSVENSPSSITHDKSVHSIAISSNINGKDIEIWTCNTISTLSWKYSTTLSYSLITQNRKPGTDMLHITSDSYITGLSWAKNSHPTQHIAVGYSTNFVVIWFLSGLEWIPSILGLSFQPVQLDWSLAGTYLLVTTENNEVSTWKEMQNHIWMNVADV